MPALLDAVVAVPVSRAPERPPQVVLLHHERLVSYTRAVYRYGSAATRHTSLTRPPVVVNWQDAATAQGLE